VTVSIKISSRVWERLCRYHLAPGKHSESLSYILAQAICTPDGITVLIPHTAPVLLFDTDCFVRQSAGNVQLAPDVLNGMLIKFAASYYNCLINVHDHWFDEFTRFSGVDDHDDLAFDAYLRKSFEPMLVKHPHIGTARPIFNLSIVLAQKGIDARLVDTRGKAIFQTANSVTVIGDRFNRLPIGSSKVLPDMAGDEIFSRHRDFIPADRQDLLSSLSIALVGCGGLGSILAESLGRIGVGGLTLIDDDTLEVTNLNRWQGGTPQAVGKPKAALLSSRLRRMFPHMRIKAIRKSVFDTHAEQALATSDLIVAGLDNDEARYYLNRVSLQYKLPYFDSGVAVTGSGNTTDFRVRYFAVLPGQTACAECTQFTLFDRDKALEAFLDEATAKSRRAAGYMVEQPLAATPSVYALNQRAASLLVTELLNYICGWRATATMISESWRDGTFQRADRDNFPEGPDPECPICGFYAGTGNTEPLPRPKAFRSQSSKSVSNC
jgi:molybdopterin/thiamine biosynthesis adenylyltransferase